MVSGHFSVHVSVNVVSVASDHFTSRMHKKVGLLKPVLICVFPGCLC